MAVQPQLSPAEHPEFELQIPAPAKINHFLHVLGRRADGYHDLQTGFQFVNWGDRLLFSPDRPWQVSGLPDVPDEENLVYRAGIALAEHANIQPSGHIHIEKQIPAGAGLGGGSSDAASALLLLRTHWGLSVSDEALIALGATLGADVPVFLYGKSAIGTGIGESLAAIEWPEIEIELFLPPVHVSTAKIFGQKWLTRDSQPINMRAALDGQGHNDCESVCRKHFPIVDALFDALAGWQPRLSGSGGTVFVLSDNVPAEVALPDGVSRRKVSTINLSPALKS